MITKPSDCALALAIPLIAEDFYQGLQPGVQKDFARSLARLHSDYQEKYLWKFYEPRLKLVNQVIETVRSRGVSVIEGVTPDQFSNLMERFQVVTLVAHWRSSIFLPSDFLAPHQLIEEVLSSTAAFTVQLRSELPQAWFNRLDTLCAQSAPPEEFAELLQQGFMHILCHTQLYKMPTAALGMTLEDYTDSYRCYLNRNVLDDYFVNKIAPGNRIEFADRLYPIEDVVRAIPENYRGTIDFNVCNSIFLGDLIKRKRRCVVLVNTLPTTLSLRLPLYQAIIDLLTVKDMAYAQADITIRKMVSQQRPRYKGDDVVQS